MMQVTVKTLDSQTKSFSVPDEVGSVTGNKECLKDVPVIVVSSKTYASIKSFCYCFYFRQP